MVCFLKHILLVYCINNTQINHIQHFNYFTFLRSNLGYSGLSTGSVVKNYMSVKSVIFVSLLLKHLFAVQ